ncbi:hypothetical protein SAMN02745163_03455 [Clostridium cavendishii DSM 21758]|uniref:CAAX prenyl protease 2/Lysostaphin resistance protein A-like domain-containing protein n=1 Tax=Clostridium cavendishii DSM 21758 TaxID=1121302 RepID=A0A1M6QUB6_9CLOT|nr:type II CAAX endopeptidase family protein [Clostridium cavendishii]SHK23765.1 hypothetical protein SAMN02745163_03455 [Clostridium cavendishii DSM 21758]
MQSKESMYKANLKKPKGPIFKANVYFLIIILIQVFGGQLLGPILKKTGFNNGINLSIAHFIFFIIPAIIYIIVTKQSAKKVFRFNKPRIQDILWAFLIGLIAQPVMVFFAVLSSFFFKNDIAQFMQSLDALPYWMMLLIMAVTPAITEEITIRGIVLSGYNQKNKHIAAIMSGILFGIFHLNAQQFLYATALGILFGYMVRVTNSIFVTMVTHFTVNGLQVSMQKFLVPVIQKVSPEKVDATKELTFNMKIAALSSYGVLAIIFGTLLVLIIMKMEKENRKIGIIQPNETKVSRGEYEASFNDGIIELNGNENSYLEYENEKILNIPLVLIIIVYIIIMVLLK